MTNEMTFEELDMVAGGNWWDTFKEGLKDFHYGFLEFIVGIDLRPRYRDEDLWDGCPKRNGQPFFSFRGTLCYGILNKMFE